MEAQPKTATVCLTVSAPDPRLVHVLLSTFLEWWGVNRHKDLVLPSGSNVGPDVTWQSTTGSVSVPVRLAYAPAAAAGVSGPGGTSPSSAAPSSGDAARQNGLVFEVVSPFGELPDSFLKQFPSESGPVSAPPDLSRRRQSTAAGRLRRKAAANLAIAFTALLRLAHSAWMRLRYADRHLKYALQPAGSALAAAGHRIAVNRRPLIGLAVAVVLLMAGLSAWPRLPNRQPGVETATVAAVPDRLPARVLLMPTTTPPAAVASPVVASLPRSERPTIDRPPVQARRITRSLVSSKDRAPAPAVTRYAGSRSAAFTASLLVMSNPPGAAVIVDGQNVGMTPLRLDRLPVGSHAVHVRLNGYDLWSTAATVVYGRQNRLAAQLSRLTVDASSALAPLSLR
jgi:hypothetical protein